MKPSPVFESQKSSLCSTSREYSNTSIFSSSSASTSSDANSNSTLNNNNESKPIKKNVLQKMWERYSFSGQQLRIDRAERLFRAAEYHAKNPIWYQSGRLPNEFRPYHSILTMHIWFLHKRLITTTLSESENSPSLVDTHTAHLIQEELFETLWADTRTRIRAQDGIHELTVNKHLKDVQQITFQHCMHYDHAFTFEDPLKRREELALAVWTHVCMRNEETYNDFLNRMALYLEWQYQNIMVDLPEHYFWEGRVNWGDVPDFSQMKDNEGNLLAEVVVSDEEKEKILPEGWFTNLTESGDLYYWNADTMESQWEKPRS